MGLQRKLESELDRLDVTDKLYERKYESLNRRLDDAFEAIENADKKIEDCEARLESIKKQGLSKESIYESLQLFTKCYAKMTDAEKKKFVNTFVDKIELYPDKKGENGSLIKTVHFKFPVSYNGEPVFNFCPPLEKHVETCCLLVRETYRDSDMVSIKVDMDGLKL